MNDREFAIAEANNNNESHKYFEARPHLNNDVSQRVYTAAFYSGFEACMRTLMKEQADTHAIELSALQADAARYLWLRDNTTSEGVLITDADIDAAMRAEHED